LIKIGNIHVKIDSLFAFQEWDKVEEESYIIFCNEIRADDILYDIGAAVGLYTVIFLKQAGSEGKVICFEPDDCALRFLERHLLLNDCRQRVIIRPVCCGKTTGSIDFYYLPGEVSGDDGVFPREGFAKKTVPLTSVDAEVERLDLPPTIIKIDVEGAEWDVLQGAEFTLKKHRPRLLISMHPSLLASRGIQMNEAIRWLQREGYSCRIIDYTHETHVFAKAVINHVH